MNRVPRVTFLIIAALLGLALWQSMGARADPFAVALLLVAGALALLPPVNRAGAALLEKLRRPAPRDATLIAIALAVASTVYLAAVPLLSGWDLSPKLHDEYSYLLQMRMLAQGRLWMPAHELADFFESFHIFVKPVCASLYFPGTALLHVPAIWLGLPLWLLPAIASGIAVGLMYRIGTELLDGAAGLLAAAFLLAASQFRAVSLSLMSQPVLLMMVLLVFFAWLRWRSQRRWTWLLLMGAASGWAVITRPVDALCWLLPLGAGVLLDLRGQGLRRAATTLAILAASAAPLLSLQLVQNVGLTGSPFILPHHRYTRLDMPQMTYGFALYDPSLQPATTLPQKRLYYQQFMTPIIRDHQPQTLARVWTKRKLPLTFAATLASPLLLALLPLSLPQLADRRRWVLAAVLPMFVLLYAPFPYLLPHYPLIAAPPLALLAIMGAWTIAENARVRFIVAAMLAALALAALHETKGVRLMQTPELRDIDRRLAEIGRPAIILFRFRPGDNYHQEPVYNTDAAWPDDAAIIRAHDLGPERNQQLIGYYACHQPQRVIYLYDRSARSLHRLGTAAELAGPIMP